MRGWAGGLERRTAVGMGRLLLATPQARPEIPTMQPYAAVACTNVGGSAGRAPERSGGASPVALAGRGTSSAKGAETVPVRLCYVAIRTEDCGMVRTALVAALFVALQSGAPAAQERAPIPAPGAAGPNWQRSLRLGDGRLFVTDGAMAIDAAVARPATLPAEAQMPAGASFIERQLSAHLPNEVGLSQLSRQGGGPYSTPSGVHLGAGYVDFLRSTVPAARLRSSGARDPVVVVLDGRAVGVVMPLAR